MLTEGGSPSTTAAAADRVPTYVVQSADNTLQLLRALVERGSLRVTEAAGLLGVVPSTAHRLLGTLCYRGFAVHEQQGGTYLPGPAVSAVTAPGSDPIGLRTRCRPVLERLREKTQETVSLLILEGAEVHFADSIDGPQSLRVASRLGISLPAHCTSGGKALLALLSRGELLERYPASRLVGRSNSSIRIRKLLEAELAEIRARGYATNFEEGDAGIGGVGVAVATTRGQPLAALAVAAPISRLGTPGDAALVVRPVRAAAEELRTALAVR
ncbi:MAG: IclR family transcriptional regulator [Acidimicrobiales bacterium]